MVSASAPRVRSGRDPQSPKKDNILSACDPRPSCPICPCGPHRGADITLLQARVPVARRERVCTTQMHAGATFVQPGRGYTLQPWRVLQARSQLQPPTCARREARRFVTRRPFLGVQLLPWPSRNGSRGEPSAHLTALTIRCSATSEVCFLGPFGQCFPRCCCLLTFNACRFVNRADACRRFSFSH